MYMPIPSSAVNLERFSPTVLAPHFVGPVVNAVADSDVDYVIHELRRHLFAVVELPGCELRDAHGIRLHAARAFGVEPVPSADAASMLPALDDILPKRAERRVAILIRDADRFIEADVQRCLTLIRAVEALDGRLQGADPATQLLLFLVGPAPSFAAVDPAAKVRAAAFRAVKVMPGDVAMQPWSRPVEFDLGPMHRLTLSFAQWYFASRGRRAERSEDRWHCIEDADVLTFIRAADGCPCFAGTFARTPEGMQLVGIRYEADESRQRVPAASEDPFTVFRGLCELLLHP